VTPRVLAEFTSQLAVLLNAGIPITKSLRILEGQLAPGPMKRIAAQLVEDVEGGTSLSEAMHEARRGVRRALHQHGARRRGRRCAGGDPEPPQRLPRAERVDQVASVKGALAYPIAIMWSRVLVLLLVFAFVIPKFKSVFESMGQKGEMHWTTETVIGDRRAHAGRGGGPTWSPPAAARAAPPAAGQGPIGYRSFMHRVALRMPLFGKLVHKSLVARFARTFGTLIQSGVPHLDALDILARRRATCT
jgi:type IV pilus assembly protein PilC